MVVRVLLEEGEFEFEVEVFLRKFVDSDHVVHLPHWTTALDHFLVEKPLQVVGSTLGKSLEVLDSFQTQTLAMLGKVNLNL